MLKSLANISETSLKRELDKAFLHASSNLCAKHHGPVWPWKFPL